MNNYKRYVTTTILSVLIVALIAASWGWSVMHANSIREQIIAERMAIASRIQTLEYLNRELGYGGMIHQFKNYVIRQDQEYARQLEVSFKNIASYENQLRASLVSANNLDLLDQAMAVIDQYRVNFSIARRMIESGAPSSETVDAIVIVDDSPALAAITELHELLMTQLRTVETRAREHLSTMDRLISSGPFLLLPLLLMGGLFLIVLYRMNLIVGRLKDTNKKVELLMETTPDSILAVEESGHIVQANKAALDYFGYGSNLIGMKVEDLMPESDRTDHVHKRLNYFRSPEVRSMAPSRQVLTLLASGELREVSVKLGFLKGVSGQVSVISIRDVTEESRARNQLLKFQSRIDYAARVTNFGIWELDLTTRHLFVDKWTHALHGCTNNDLNGHYAMWLDTVHEDDREKVRDHIREAISDQLPIDVQYRTVTATGEFLWLQLSAGLLPDTADTEHKMIGVCRDVTLMHDAQEELERSRAQALDANRLKSEFLANMSHEIRTPMNAVLGLLTMLNQSPLAEQQRKMITTARNSALSLLDILNDILDFSKLEAGQVHLIPAEFELETLLGKVVDLHAPIAHQKGLNIYLDVAHSVHETLVGDHNKIAQILTNLISNAIKFTSVGSVSIRVTEAFSVDQTHGLRFSVRDTGIGMTRDDLEAVLEPFIQVDSSSTRDFGGTGLGLPICSALLALMKSRLEIDSTPGQGSEFSFSLPLQVKHGAKRFSDRRLSISEAVLLMDDARLGTMIEKYLQQWLVTVTRFTDVNDLIDYVRDANTDVECVITDGRDTNLERPVEALSNFLEQLDESDRPRVIWLQTGELGWLDAVGHYAFSPNILLLPPTPVRLYNAMSSEQDTSLALSYAGNDVQQAVFIAEAYRGASILLVEDVVTNQIVARDYLATLGMTVDVAKDGKEAIDLVGQKGYDLIFMDVHMPRMNGLETTRRIRQMPMCEHIPIVAMTAAAFAEDRAKALESGMNDYLTKPIDILQLADAIVRQLSVHATQLEPATASSESMWSAKAPEALDPSILPNGIDSQWVQKHYGSKPRLYLTCLRAFVHDFEYWSDHLESAREEGDDKQISALLHKLKGTTSNIGASGIKDFIVEEYEQEGLPRQEFIDQITQRTEALLADIRRITARDALNSLDWDDAKEATASEAQDSVKKLKGYLSNYNYIPSDVLNTCLLKLSSKAPKESVDRFKRRIEAFDYYQALIDLKEIEDCIG